MHDSLGFLNITGHLHTTQIRNRRRCAWQVTTVVVLGCGTTVPSNLSMAPHALRRSEKLLNQNARG